MATTDIKVIKLTPETLPKIVHTIAVKKRDIENPEIIDALKKLLNASPNRLDPSRNKAVLVARKRILEQATSIYYEADESELYYAALEETEVIENILKLIEDEQ